MKKNPLDWPIITLASVPAKFSPGNTLEFYSEADYWWKDPETGKYVLKDGQSNPDCFNRHRKLLHRMNWQVSILAKDYLSSNNWNSFQKLQALLYAWFVNPETAMKPHLKYAQSLRNCVSGRSFGLIDTLPLAETALIIKLLHGQLDSRISKWFELYLEWFCDSPFGKEERSASNNHSICWYLQAASFAFLINDLSKLKKFREDFKKKLVKQIAADGSFPNELKRTKPYGYSLFTLEAITGLAAILSSGQDNYFIPEELNILKAVEFMYSFVLEREQWPYEKDILYNECWPAKQSAFYLAWYFTREKKYLDLWEKLKHRKITFEYFRNFPVRTPELWITAIKTENNGVKNV